ncbi:hypothetical protein [Mycoplasma buteonis]|uniref:hypothetical protein n=1 Tax=Mycoplasma buteonis TaxID=171280 RepID=UPI0005609A23|nr:hypothetical protein [Mycoplasma buteonis]
MNKLIKALEKKLEKDKKNFKRYKFLDTFTSVFIAIFNIAIIVLAIDALVTLIKLSNEKGNNVDIFTYVILIILVVLILTTFIITIALAIYKYNSRQNEYFKLLNTIKYLETKYLTGHIKDEELDELAEKIIQKANNKTKLLISKAITEQITKGPK